MSQFTDNIQFQQKLQTNFTDLILTGLPTRMLSLPWKTEPTSSISFSLWTREDASQTEPVTTKPLSSHSFKHLLSSSSFLEHVCTLAPNPASSSTVAFLVKNTDNTRSKIKKEVIPDNGSSLNYKKVSFVEDFEIHEVRNKWEFETLLLKIDSLRETRFHECHQWQEQSFHGETISSLWICCSLPLQLIFPLSVWQCRTLRWYSVNRKVMIFWFWTTNGRGEARGLAILIAVVCPLFNKTIIIILLRWDGVVGTWHAGALQMSMLSFLQSPKSKVPLAFILKRSCLLGP